MNSYKGINMNGNKNNNKNLNLLLNPTEETNPFELYDILRDDHPVHYFKDYRMWSISKYNDVKHALTCSDTFSSVGTAKALIPQWLLQTPYCREYPMLFNDGAEHSTFKDLLTKHMSRSTINDLKPAMQEDADAIISAIANGTRCDVVSEVAYPYAESCIFRLLGIKKNEDFEGVREWAKIMEQHPLECDTSYLNKLNCYNDEISSYIRELFNSRLTTPRNDLISHLAFHQDKIPQKKSLQLIELILRAGIQPVAQSIASMILRISENNQLIGHLKSSSDGVAAFLQETLRCDPVEHVVARKTTKDAEVSNTKIPKNSLVALLVASANRDPDQFEKANTFDMSRSTNKAHLSFGAGIHRCIGEAMAKAEVSILIETLLNRFDRLETSNSEKLARSYRFTNYTIDSLPMIFRTNKRDSHEE